MANAKVKDIEAPKKKKEPSPEKALVETKLAESDDNRVRFLVWFTEALERFKGLKPHHMTAIKVYFSQLGLSEPEIPNAYDEGLRKFGFK